MYFFPGGKVLKFPWNVKSYLVFFLPAEDFHAGQHTELVGTRNITVSCVKSWRAKR